MANVIGRGRRQALETRRSPYKTGQLVCTACTATRKAKGKTGLVPVKKCRILQDGLNRPGVQCPLCLTAWIEHDDQPEPVH